jgi:hypothetical protein
MLRIANNGGKIHNGVEISFDANPAVHGLADFVCLS